MNRRRKTMALDIGDARIGIATSDALGLLATPHSTLERKNNYLRRLVQLIRDENIGELVLGFPLTLEGAIGEQANKVEKFRDKLLKELQSDDELAQINCVLWDERFTTIHAAEVMGSSNLKNKARSAHLDKLSAALILEGYLESKRGSSERQE